jgi:hypothetical protein
MQMCALLWLGWRCAACEDQHRLPCIKEVCTVRWVLAARPFAKTDEVCVLGDTVQSMQLLHCNAVVVAESAACS